jgi:multidrug efflux pump
MGGLVVATVLTLFFLPALYAAWFRVGRPLTAKPSETVSPQIHPFPMAAE